MADTPTPARKRRAPDPVIPSPRILGVRDAARYLGLSAQTLKAWRKTHPPRVPFIRLSVNKCGYLIADLDRFIDECRARSA